MDTSPEKIVVFESYDTVMDANLAKTKLDAYGIPCFLTEENFTNLYPIRNSIFPGVRLHVFEQDVEEVKILLSDQPIPPSIHCPHCGSRNWQTDQKVLSRIYSSFLLVIGATSPLEEMEYHCIDCGKDFDA